jgi:hypothetical protein
MLINNLLKIETYSNEKNQKIISSKTFAYITRKMGGNSSKNSTGRKDKSSIYIPTIDIPTPIKVERKPWSLQEKQKNKIPFSGFYHNEPVNYFVNGCQYKSEWIGYMGQETHEKLIGHVDGKNSTKFRDYCIKFLERIRIKDPNSLLIDICSAERQKDFSKWCIMSCKGEYLSWDRVVNILNCFFNTRIRIEQIYIEDYFKDGVEYTLKIYREEEKKFYRSYVLGGN